MAEIRTVICDGCKEECKYYISISEANLRVANGKKGPVSIGFQDFKIKNMQFCSAECFELWFEKYLPDGDKDDYFFPSRQIGKKSANGTELGK